MHEITAGTIKAKPNPSCELQIISQPRVKQVCPASKNFTPPEPCLPSVGHPQVCLTEVHRKGQAK